MGLTKHLDDPEFWYNVMWTDFWYICKKWYLAQIKPTDLGAFKSWSGSILYTLHQHRWCSFRTSPKLRAEYRRVYDRRTEPGMWYQMVGSTVHSFLVSVRENLFHMFRQQCISHYASTRWPARSCGLIQTHFFLWGCIKKIFMKQVF